MFIHEKTCVIIISEYKKAQKVPKVSHLIFIAVFKDQIMKLQTKTQSFECIDFKEHIFYFPL